MTHARAFATQERQQQVLRLSRFSRSMLLALTTVLSFLTIALVVTDQLYRPDAFVINELKIKGRFNHLQPQEVESVVQSYASGNFFSIELQKIKQKVADLPWVQSAEVRREWPGTLQIQVTEQQPIMRWDDDRWVNSQGNVIQLPGKIKLNNAMTLSGNEDYAYQMMHQALRWQQRLEEKGLSLLKLSLSDRHAYVLHLSDQANNSNFDVLLGRDQAESRFTRFLNLFDQQFKHSDQTLRRVDARYPNGVAVNSETITKKIGLPSELAQNQPKSDSISGNH